ncbi:MAG: Tse2 family ADP-ribosyltransferase toxin [Rhodanobacter sp.]
MATTDIDLYRSVMGNGFKSIKVGIYPGDGVLDPRWESTQYFSKKLNRMVTSQADVTVELGNDGPEVLPDGGTSLHDVSGWFPAKEFWIPEGTEYSDEVIRIRKDTKLKTSPYNPRLAGHHYQLEPRTRMTVLAFKGALDNMARAAVVRQCALART